MRVKNKHIFILTLFSLLTTSIWINSYIYISSIDADNICNKQEIDNFENNKVKYSTISTKIHIDNNWSAAKTAGICTGEGTYSQPYVIKDLEIDGGNSGSCILIENSDVYFQIKNCNIYNSGSDFFEDDAGIKINNTINGKLINNDVSHNNRKGIYLIYSQNITISGNTVSRNTHIGIYLQESNYTMILGNTANNNHEGINVWDSKNNTISGNTVNRNKFGGIELADSHNNTILGNIANDNGRFSQGVSLVRSNNNQISENTLNNNQYGIYLLHSSYNIITNNILLGNTEAHWVVSGDCIGNVFSGNTIPVNRQPLIITSTIIGGCIIAVVVVVGVIIYRKKTAISREVRKEEKERLEKEAAEILFQLSQISKREGILNCFYHPERDASTKCEKCGRMICLECKTVYHEVHSTGTGDSRSSYSIRREFCPVCFYDQKIRMRLSIRKVGRIIASIFTIIVLIVVLVLVFLKGWLASFIFLPFLIPIDILAFAYGPHSEVEFERQKVEFLNSVKTIQQVKEERLKGLFCPECGNQLEPDVSVCSYCGTIIKE